MGDSPSALLLGESEIDRVETLLRDLDVGFDRVHTPRAAMHLPTPSRLLVVSGPCVARMPTLLPGDDPNADPIRICIHSQDFLPLRERLRAKGFHYLVQTALDETSLRVFLMQLLHPAASRRKHDRLPLGGEVEYRSDSASGAAKLADLSLEGCRITGVHGLLLGEPAAVLLPAALGGGTPLPLQGHVMRCQPASGETPPSAVIRFGVLDDDARERLQRLVQGELIGTRLTPLADAPSYTEPGDRGRSGEAAPVPEPVPEPQGSPAERRREDRHPYDGRVDVLELPGDANGALGRDLSLKGVRISGGPPLAPGMKVTLALYGGHGVEPAVVQAEVIRSGASDVALVFGGLAEEQEERLVALIAEPAALETLATGDGASARVVAARVLERPD